MQRSKQRRELNLVVILPDLSCERPRQASLERENTKLNARLALRQRADLLVANISTNRISLPQGQSYTEGKYCLYGGGNGRIA